ncbi:MAG: 50S ribosomal protein L23 [Ktedonobacterales bacterium]
MEITEVIRHGIITEKSVDLQNTRRETGSNAGTIVPRYTFRVALEANKYEIRLAVEAMFPGVKVVRVNTMRMPGKTKTTRTRRGYFIADARPWKKAIVTLADGQTINELQA